MKRQLKYSDTKFQEQMKIEIIQAQEKMQILLDEWNTLNLPPITDIFELVYQPQRVHAKAINDSVEVPVSMPQYQLKKDVYVSLLDIPIPNSLYIKARTAKQNPATGRKELWSVSKDGKKVLLNQVKADELIGSRNIWVENEAQMEFVENVIAYMESGKYIFEKMNTMAGNQTLYAPPYSLIQKGYGLINVLQLEPEMLREMIKSL